mmetsp:Transcript_1437/g.2889  ORF Transcript_1437/g.2889 Transcript_1437/m.2889 type:complete len:215 (+) Transcript_1437:135-779(+)
MHRTTTSSNVNESNTGFDMPMKSTKKGQHLGDDADADDENKSEGDASITFTGEESTLSSLSTFTETFPTTNWDDYDDFGFYQYHYHQQGRDGNNRYYHRGYDVNDRYSSEHACQGPPTCSADTLLEAMGDVGNAISSILRNNGKLNVTNRSQSTLISKVRDTMRRQSLAKERKEEERRVLEEERKLKRQIVMQNEIRTAREECGDVARMWRQGY